MAVYEYHAKRPGGEQVLGQLAAENEDAARRELVARGWEVVDILCCPTVGHEETLRDEELTTFVAAIGGATTNRLPVEITLAALAEETNDRRLATVAQRLAVQLQQGATIEQAIAGLGRLIPTEVGGLLRAGIATGDIAGMLERLALQRMAAKRIRRRIESAIAYPLIIAAILVPLVLFLSLYVIPMFEELFQEFDLRLPTITELMLRTAEQVPMLIGGVLVLVLGIPIVLHVLGGRWLFHRVRSALPLLGPMWTWSGQREFAALLASFINLRVTTIDSVAYTGDAISDRNVGHACRRVAKRLESGDTLSSCLSQSIHFDRSLVALVAWGERYGLLPEALGIAASLFDDQIEQYASLLRRLLPPVTLVVVAALMFFVIVSLMVPLVSLIQNLSQ